MLVRINRLSSIKRVLIIDQFMIISAGDIDLLVLVKDIKPLLTALSTDFVSKLNKKLRFCESITIKLIEPSFYSSNSAIIARFSSVINF